MKKSHVAFRNNLEFLTGSKLYLWTFTLPRVVAISEACAMWSELSKELVRVLGWKGLRVFELHRRHGLHVHCLTEAWFDVNQVRAICLGVGWGRIHVKKVPRAAGVYLAKYLTKGSRPECLKGRRLWATVGRWARKSLVASIVVYSAWTVAYRSIEAFRVVRRMGYDPESARGSYARAIWASSESWRYGDVDIDALMAADRCLGAGWARQASASDHV